VLKSLISVGLGFSIEQYASTLSNIKETGNSLFISETVMLKSKKLMSFLLQIFCSCVAFYGCHMGGKAVWNRHRNFKPQQQTTEHDSVNFLRVSEEQQLGMRIVELTNTSMLAVFLLCRFLITFRSQV
jgi:hypothetical protein